ncbi:hypothetical protein F8388_008900 [Cannabis sativa]|uniref:Uncharacterized protein n=1 Tax=Cannabis sativa TaxID=3483 RepID=A0A7J6H8A4_CANSA|nr:hypothetical protein F8388_008900 [Cannabis sativa]
MTRSLQVVEYSVQEDGDDVKIDDDSKEKAVSNKKKLKEKLELHSKEDDNERFTSKNAKINWPFKQIRICDDN